MICLWEILVPTVRNDGRPYRLKYHRVWDEKVRAISGGMSICTPIHGRWVSETGQIFSERMIPVRVAATVDQINEIIDFTLVYYDQMAIMAYRITDYVIIKGR